MKDQGKGEGIMKTWIRVILLTAAVCFVAQGIMRGEMRTVLLKATRICLECMGIG